MLGFLGLNTNQDTTRKELRNRYQHQISIFIKNGVFERKSYRQQFICTKAILPTKSILRNIYKADLLLIPVQMCALINHFKLHKHVYNVSHQQPFQFVQTCTQRVPLKNRLKFYKHVCEVFINFLKLYKHVHKKCSSSDSNISNIKKYSSSVCSMDQELNPPSTQALNCLTKGCLGF